MHESAAASTPAAVSSPEPGRIPCASPSTPASAPTTKAKTPRTSYAQQRTSKSLAINGAEIDQIFHVGPGEFHSGQQLEQLIRIEVNRPPHSRPPRVRARGPQRHHVAGLRRRHDLPQLGGLPDLPMPAKVQAGRPRSAGSPMSIWLRVRRDIVPVLFAVCTRSRLRPHTRGINATLPEIRDLYWILLILLKLPFATIFS